MLMITLELLNHMPSGKRACADAREWFASQFPFGAELEAVWETCTDVSWKIWFTCNYLPKGQVVALAYKFCGQAFRVASECNPSLKKFADNISADNLMEAYTTVATRTVATRTAAYAAAAATRDAAAYAYAAAAYAYADAAYADAATRDAVQSEQLEWCWKLLSEVK